MWDKIPTKETTSVSPIISPKQNSIDDIVEVSGAFWKNMHPDYQKIYELGSTLSKIDVSDDNSLIASYFKSILIIYKNNIFQSNISNAEKDEELKKLQLIDEQINTLQNTFKLLKKPVDVKQVSAYILGSNVNLYKRNKN